MKSDLSKVKVGDKIWTIQGGWVEVTSTSIKIPVGYPIETEGKYTYTIDGKGNSKYKYPSAFLEYPFKEQPIEKFEKDTLVWFRDRSHDFWKYGYYSHFENGKHYIFNDSKKSTETSTIQAWYIVTTENPLS
jgi:hypothetical protein